MRYLIAASIFALSACGAIELPDGCEPQAGEIDAWVKANRIATEESYQDFLNQYPNGCFARRANDGLRQAIRAEQLSRVRGDAESRNEVSAY